MLKLVIHPLLPWECVFVYACGSTGKKEQKGLMSAMWEQRQLD